MSEGAHATLVLGTWPSRARLCKWRPSVSACSITAPLTLRAGCLVSPWQLVGTQPGNAAACRAEWLSEQKEDAREALPRRGKVVVMRLYGYAHNRFTVVCDSVAPRLQRGPMVRQLFEHRRSVLLQGRVCRGETATDIVCCSQETKAST